jgi:transcription-repair coupling factor (superfamily II helicase)
MEAVGYDMYLQLLGEAIEEEKTGEEVKEKRECVIDVSVDAHIPEDYIDSVKNRIFMYKRIAAIENGEDAMDVMDEFIDRFGDIPAEVVNLIDVTEIRNVAREFGFEDSRNLAEDGVISLSL